MSDGANKQLNVNMHSYLLADSDVAIGYKKRRHFSLTFI